MSVLLRLAIRLYWRIWPAAWRRRCLYRESCSRHVYRIAAEAGFRPALRALRRRYRTCRPGYHLILTGPAPGVYLADGSFLYRTEASPHLFEAVEAAAHRAETRLLRDEGRCEAHYATGITWMGRDRMA